MQNQKNSVFPLYQNCFSKGYWKSAFSELRSLRMLVLAAVLIAFRIALKTVSVPVADGLSITFGFMLNALGSAVYGPVVGGISGIICDVLGYFVHPSGPFMPLFVIIEMMGSVVYGLFLYKAPFSASRIFASKFTMNVVMNIGFTSLAMNFYYGKGIMYYMIPRIIKNMVMLPFETAVLILIFNAALKPLIQMRLVSSEQSKIKLDIVSIIIKTVISAIAAALILLLLYVFFQSGAYKTMLDWVRAAIGQ